MSYEANLSDDCVLSPIESLTFGGETFEDVTVFLGAAKRVAILQGRLDDDGWILNYIESCLRGDAMRWYDSLASSIPRPFAQWSDVRRLFLSRFNNYVPPAPPPAAAAPPRTLIARFKSPKAPTPSSIHPPRSNSHYKASSEFL